MDWQHAPVGRKLVLNLPGGRGFGNPAERSKEAIADDLSKGYVTNKRTDNRETGMNRIASRLAAIKPSASMAASQAAMELASTGVDVIDLGLGEPDFAAPGHVTDAAYGLSPFFHISIASSDEVLVDAIRRIAAAVALL